jgi:hypothetical protein
LTPKSDPATTGTEPEANSAKIAADTSPGAHALPERRRFRARSGYLAATIGVLPMGNTSSSD